jgi:tetratricopeptide (TPR) repeat protein
MLCGHSMHYKCMSSLLKRAEFNDPAKCPLCRGRIEPESMADQLCAFGYENDCEMSLQSALRLDRYHVFALYSIGLFRLLEEDVVGAIRYFERAIKAPVFVTTTRYYQHRIAAANSKVELATIYYENDMRDEAKAFLEIAAAEYKKLDLHKSPFMAHIYAGCTCIAMDEGRFEDAIKSCEALLSITDHGSPFYVQTMEMYIYALQNANQILKMITTAQRLFSTVPTAHSRNILAGCLAFATGQETI